MQLLLAVLAGAVGAVSARSPNILFVITDDQDADLGSLSVMPTVQSRIFDEGLQFDAAFVASPICCPSRTALFSGRYPHNLNDNSLGWCGNFTAQREDNFLTAIKSAGWTVGQFGKWYNEEGSFCHDGYMPTWKKSSTDDFFVMCEEVRYYNMTYNSNGKIITTGDAPTDYLTSVIGNRTMQWLDNVTANGNPTPWIGYVALHAPHLPATPAPWYLNAPLPSPGYPHAPRTPNWNTGWADKHWQIDNGIDKPMSEALINASDTLWANRLRSLMSVDDLVSDMFSLLEQRGQLDNTFIFYTTDHGYHLGQWGVWSEKANPYDMDARVLLAARGPGVATGASTAAMVSNLDLAPTLMDIAGVPNRWPSGTEQRDGKSILSLLQSNSTEPPAGWRDRLVVEFVGWQTVQWLAPCQYGQAPTPCPANPPAGMTNAQSNCYASLRVINGSTNTLIADYRPQFAPMHPATANWTEAYDLSSDPWQLNNLAVKGRAPPSQIAAMRADLWTVATCRGTACP